MSKAELRAWATTFHDAACFRVGEARAAGQNLLFSFDGRESLTAEQLEARLKTADPQLAQRFRAWFDATTALGTYAHDRLEGKDG